MSEIAGLDDQSLCVQFHAIQWYFPQHCWKAKLEQARVTIKSKLGYTFLKKELTMGLRIGHGGRVSLCRPQAGWTVYTGLGGGTDCACDLLND